MRRKKFLPLKNQKGMLTVDFLFSMVMAALLCVLFFALTTTLSVVEISQYIAYSVSRAYAAGHLDYTSQRRMGMNKYKYLTAKERALGPLLNNGWYSLIPENADIDSAVEFRGGKAPGSGDETVFSEYPSSEENRMPQTGIRLTFYAKILNMNLSILGSTKRDDNYKAKITGLILREPTQAECQEWMLTNNRYEAILNLDPNRFGAATKNNRSPYVPMEDNGC